MLKNRIIPCLDVKNGRVVKGINFVDLKDAGDPVEQAKIYSDGGADEICFLDITASHENRNTMLEVVKKTTEKCFVRKTGMKYHIDLHAIVDADISVREGHDIAHRLKDFLMQEMDNIENVMIHIEPSNVPI